MKLLLVLSIIIVLIIFFIIYFFRRQKPLYYPKNMDILYSPGYGKILKVFNINNHLCISIFLSPFDIHRQYIPINGIIRNIMYDCTGQFNLAFNETKSRMNEKYITELETKYGNIIIYQIAGKLVRGIENTLNIGEQVITGQEMGIIKWGSRVDVLIPKTSRFEIYVKKGDIVNGTYSKLGRFY